MPEFGEAQQAVHAHAAAASDLCDELATLWWHGQAIRAVLAQLVCTAEDEFRRPSIKAADVRVADRIYPKKLAQRREDFRLLADLSREAITIYGAMISNNKKVVADRRSVLALLRRCVLFAKKGLALLAAAQSARRG